MTIPEQKAALRRELTDRRTMLTERAERSALIVQQLYATAAFQAARAIHCYLSMRSEVETKCLIDTAIGLGKMVAVPVVERDKQLRHCWINSTDPANFTPGVLGTARPQLWRAANLGDWDITIVPMLGFDRAGYRIGYGKGYYDQLLQTPTIAIGLAFAAQEVAALPREPHDQRLDYLITENEMVTIPNR